MSKFMDDAIRKVSQAQNFLMKSGRNFQGYLETKNRILTTARNYEAMGYGSNYEPMQSVFRGFSESRNDFSEAGAGLNAVANTMGIDVVDISILTSVKSFLPYLAVDRGMSKPTDLLTYQKLVAVNEAGGMEAGKDVVNPFAPISRKLALSRANASSEITITGDGTATTKSATPAFPIAKARATFTLTTGSTVVNGSDILGDGKVYWQGAGVATDIDYEKGTITATVPSGSTLVAKVYADTTSETDGAHTLKLRTATENIKVTAEPNRVILETSMEQIAYMNRLLGNGMGTQKEFGQIALQQLLNAFIYWINSDLVTTTISAAKSAVSDSDVTTKGLTFSMSGYDMSKFAGTKNDLMNKFMLDLDSDLLSKSNQGTTYYLVGIKGANILANNSDKFVKSDIFGQQLNGVIGTYGGVPVLRHDIMTAQDEADSTINVIAGHKDASGAAAPIIYGEYLPLYSTKAAVNFNNPTELSQAMFNMSKSAPLIENYITRGTITVA